MRGGEGGEGGGGGGERRRRGRRRRGRRKRRRGRRRRQWKIMAKKQKEGAFNNHTLSMLRWTSSRLIAALILRGTR